MDNNWDPYEELVAHANLLRQHDRNIRSLLVHDSHMTHDFHRLQKQMNNLLDILEAQDRKIQELEARLNQVRNDPL